MTLRNSPFLTRCHGTALSDSRPHSVRTAMITALALLVLPVVSGCSKNSSSAPQPEAANPNDTLIARINGAEIRESDLAFAEEDLGNDLQGPPDHKREQLITYLTDVILGAAAAEKRNLADNADFKRRQTLMRNKLLMGLLLTTQAKTAATDDELRKVYDEAVKPMAAEEEVRARHILVENEDEAKAIAEQIRGGADFEALAKEKSKDPGSAAEGGDLGYFAKGQMVKVFEDVAFALEKGKYTAEPVKSDFGFHVIKLDDKRKQPPPSFEEVKEQLQQLVMTELYRDTMADLRKNAKIVPPLAVAPAAPAPAAK